MNAKNSPKKLAVSLLRRYHISIVTLDIIVRAISDFGFDVIDFSTTENGESINALIHSLGVEDYISRAMAFTYSYNNTKLVFVSENLKPEDKLYVLAHELGHIACGHLDNKGILNACVEEEREANEFAHYLLNPLIGWKIGIYIQVHKFVSVLAALTVFAAVVFTIMIPRLFPARQPYGEYYVTSSGAKYHEADCYIIKNKTNIRRLTVEEFESGAYEPCKICLPD